MADLSDLDLKVVQAGLQHLDELTQLFDDYRQFYRQAPDSSGAKAFLHERLTQGDSVVFIAFLDGKPAGFTQLYPTFSSVSMAQIWILNDLFVGEHARRSGVAKALMEQAANFGKEVDAARLTLTTEVNNEKAQALYEALGWEKDTSFYTYNLAL